MTTNQNNRAHYELGIANWNTFIKKARVNQSYQEVYSLLERAYFELPHKKVKEWLQQFLRWTYTHRNEPIKAIDFKIRAYLAISSEGELRLELLDMLSDCNPSFNDSHISITSQKDIWPETFCEITLGDGESGETTEQKDTSREGVYEGPTNLGLAEAQKRICNWQKYGEEWIRKTLGQEQDLFFRAFNIPFVDLMELDLEEGVGDHFYVILALKEVKHTSLSLNTAKFKVSPELILGKGNIKNGMDSLHFIISDDSASAADLSTLVPPFKPTADAYQLYEQSMGISV